MISQSFFKEKLPSLNPTVFGWKVCAPNHGYGPAVRWYWLIHYVVSGKGIYEIDGQHYSVKPGEMFVIPPHKVTYYQADEQYPWQYIWIGFTADTMPVELPPVIHCPGAGGIFDSMKASNDIENGQTAYLCGKIWDLMALFLQQQKVENDYVSQALNMIQAGYGESNMSISLVANTLHINRTYLSVLFKKKTGLSPQQHLIRLRMEKAAELMLQHHQTPSIAAVSVGYADFCNFSKMFKQYYGLSPREYVKANGK